MLKCSQPSVRVRSIFNRSISSGSNNLDDMKVRKSDHRHCVDLVKSRDWEGYRECTNALNFYFQYMILTTFVTR